MHTDDETQTTADGDEAESALRLRNREEFHELIQDAVKRAEAMQRLELSLLYGSVLPPPESERPPVHMREKPRR